MPDRLEVPTSNPRTQGKPDVVVHICNYRALIVRWGRERQMNAQEFSGQLVWLRPH